MREIKFRGIDNNGIWQYGNLASNITTSVERYGIKPSLCTIIIEFNHDDKVQLLYNFVKSETVGQFTGIKD